MLDDGISIPKIKRNFGDRFARFDDATLSSLLLHYRDQLAEVRAEIGRRERQARIDNAMQGDFFSFAPRELEAPSGILGAA